MDSVFLTKLSNLYLTDENNVIGMETTVKMLNEVLSTDTNHAFDSLYQNIAT